MTEDQVGESQKFIRRGSRSFVTMFRTELFVFLCVVCFSYYLRSFNNSNPPHGFLKKKHWFLSVS